MKAPPPDSDFQRMVDMFHRAYLNYMYFDHSADPLSLPYEVRLFQPSHMGMIVRFWFDGNWSLMKKVDVQ